MAHCNSYNIECPYALSEFAPVPCVGSQEQCDLVRASQNYKGEPLQVGDHVRVKGTPMEFEITGFNTKNGQIMAESKYGDFNAELLELLKTDF